MHLWNERCVVWRSAKHETYEKLRLVVLGINKEKEIQYNKEKEKVASLIYRVKKGEKRMGGKIPAHLKWKTFETFSYIFCYGKRNTAF